METVKQFDRLYSKTSKQKINIWDLSVKTDRDNNISYICTITGNIDGKLREYKKKVEKGKNIGKKNETSHLEQAIKQATSLYTKKMRNSCYKKSQDELESATLMTPMSAQYFEKRMKYIDFKNAYVQPKLDGVRCILKKENDDVKLYSKNGLEFFNLEHIKNDIHKYFKKLPDNIILDGELYTTKFPFNEINGFVRRKKVKKNLDEKISKIEFHVFDCFDLNDVEWTFENRYKFLKKRFKKYFKKSLNPILCLVDTKKVESEQQVYEYNTDYIKNHYEGIMIRNGLGVYKNSKTRSNDLQKYKLFKDDEFEITGYQEGSGTDKGTVIWVCSVGEHKFTVRPKGTVEERKDYYNNGDKYIGQKLTVRFQEYSENGVPRFPVGLRIRTVDW